MAAVVSHHPFRHARRAGRIEDVQRIGRSHRHACSGLCRGCKLGPVDVPPRNHWRLLLRSLQDDAAARLHLGELDRLVEERLVRHDAVHLDAARSGDDDVGAGVADTRRQLVRREASEHDRMDGADPRAREHRHDRLGDHRHVNDHTVALPDAQPGEGAGEAGDLIAQLAIREALDRARDRTVVDERRLVGAAVLHVPVEGVVAGVHLRAREPAVERGTRAVEHTVPPLVPVDRLAGFGPKSFRVLDPLGVDVVLDALRGVDAGRGVHESPWVRGADLCSKAAGHDSARQHACRGPAGRLPVGVRRPCFPPRASTGASGPRARRR